MKELYRFFWDCGRGGRLEGFFVASPEDVKSAIGSDLYFGEVLGKHSEVEGELEAGDITIKSSDPDFIAKFEEIIGESIGYNPLHYLREYED